MMLEVSQRSPKRAELDPLRRILELEKAKGYADLAVIGGLDKFLRRWAERVKENISQPKLLRRFDQLVPPQPGYAAWDTSKRREWSAQLLNLLAEIESTNEALPKAESPPLEKKRPVRKVGSPPGQWQDAPLTTVKGINAATATRFRRLGVSTVRELLYFFPRRYLDYSQKKAIAELVPGEEQTIVATVWEARQTRLGLRPATEAIVGDDSGNLRVVWFNQPYLAKKLATNSGVVLSGRVALFKGRRVMENPEWELAEEGELIHAGRLVPVYHLTEGLYQRQVRRIMKEVVDTWAPQLPDFLPDEIKVRCQLLELPQAIAQANFPEEHQLRERARLRLAFDELFLLQLGVRAKKKEWQQQPGPRLSPDGRVLDKFLAGLPFHLTAAQQRVLAEVLADLARPQPMCRLLQGEVGSGKTVVAAAALTLTAASGYQGALMAPTEILAEQHFRTLTSLLSQAGQAGEDNLRSYPGLLERPLTLALLTGSLSQGQKQELQELAAGGQIDILVGTHALIQEGVTLPQLGLAVVDEQHRFGVAQRAALRQKGFNPHLLAMTATPIPRSLALTLYGDLDLSVIDELPPGRQVIKTRYLGPEQRASAYAFVRRQVAAGRQTFVICPLIEESEAVEARAATTEYEHLSREVFSDLRLGLLHGRMPSREKDEVMQRFRAGELDILVSTPVVEVGIDVPNATVMLVEGADRFGLSQLHQFRGRVGRGQHQSYCMLLSENPSAEARERLARMERIQDGFALAEEDLRLRGPGQFFGVRQSGLPDLTMARLSDIALLELARREASQLLDQNPGLTSHPLLSQEVARLWSGVTEVS